MRGLGGKIFGLIVSVVLIIGGLSGKLVLRGTNSSTALVVAGVIFLIIDIYQVVTHSKKAREAEEAELERYRKSKEGKEFREKLESTEKLFHD